MADLSNILIVTDLDGTFFGNHGAPIERNLEAVERLKALREKYHIPEPDKDIIEALEKGDK